MRRPNRLPNYLETDDIINFEAPYSYLIHKDGTNIVAKNGQTGEDEFISTDFSTILDDCLKALPTGAEGGGLINIKKGTYYMDTAVTVSSDLTAVGIVGEATSFVDEGTLIVCNDTMDYMFTTKADFFFSKRIFWKGNNKTDSPMVINKADAVLDQCSFSTGKEENITIRQANCNVNRCWIEVGYKIGVNLFRIQDLKITNCIFYNNAYEDICINSYTGITVPKTVQIVNNRFQTSDNCIYLSGAGGEISNVIIANNIFNNIGQTASAQTFHDNVIYVNGVVHHVLIANNICYGDSGGTDYTQDFLEFKNGGTYTNFELANNIIHEITGNIVTNPANCTQLVQNNSSTNAGIPGAAGQWATGGYEGLIVHDASNDKVYVYVDGAWELLT